MLKQITLAAGLLFFSSLTISQSISNSFVNSQYGESRNNIRVNYSIGDVFYGRISNPDLQLSGMINIHLKGTEAMGINFNQKILAYPNPCRSFIYIQTESAILYNVKIWDLNGMVIKNELILGNQAVNMSDLTNGIYILQVSDLEYASYFFEKIVKSD